MEQESFDLEHPRDPQPAPARRDLAQQAGRLLQEDEFVRAMVDGAGQYHLRDWSDALLEAVETTAPEFPFDVPSLCRLLRTSRKARRTVVNPFAGYMEAPQAIIDLYQEHGSALKDLEAELNVALDEMVRDTATSLFRAIDPPITWGQLMVLGVSPERPPAPPVSDDDW